MVNKRKIRLTEKELEQFVGEIVDSVMINEQADHSKFASQLYNAMDGLGTDEETVRKISNYGAASDIAKWFDQNKNKFEGYTLKQWIRGDFSGNEVNVLINKFYPQQKSGDTKKRGTDCPTPKPWKTEGTPLQVGDRLGTALQIDSINVLTQHLGSVKLTLSKGGGIINIYGDEVQSAWDVGGSPLTVELGLKRYGDDLPTPKEIEKNAAMGEGYDTDFNYIPYNMFVDLGFEELGYGTRKIGTFEDDKTKYDFNIPSYNKRDRDYRGNPYTFYLIKMPIHVFPEGYDVTSIGTVKKDYKGREYVQLDEKKVIEKYGEYPWIFVDTNQAGSWVSKNKGKIFTGSEESYRVKNTGTYHTQSNGDRVSADELLKTTNIPLVTVEGNKGALIRKSKPIKLILSLSNSPDLWQGATELTGLATGYGKKGEGGEWARNGCNIRVETNNKFVLETFEQNKVNSPKHNTTGSDYEEQVFLRGTENVLSSFEVRFHVNMVQGVAASYMRDEWFEDKPYDSDGSYNWRKGSLNPANWSYHTFLEIIGAVLLVALGFVSGGSTWYVLGAYITVNTANAIGYAMEGDYDMALLSLAFDFIPAGKLGKLFNLSVKSMVAPTKIIKGTLGVLQSFRSGGNIKSIMKTLKTNQEYLKLMRILAKDGAKMSKQMKSVFKQMKNQPITKESIDAFRKQLVNSGGSAGKLGAKLTDAELKIILKQQQTKTARYLDDLVNGGNFGQIIRDAAILISLYDANIPLSLVQKYLLKIPTESQLKVPSLGKALEGSLDWALSGVEWFDNITEGLGVSDGAIVDIVNSTPCGSEDKQREAISKQTLLNVKNIKDYNPKFGAQFYPWCEGDYYIWDKGIKYQYSAATSPDLLDLKGGKIEDDCEFISPNHYGITKNNPINSVGFNTALKKDWLGGWRPGYCVQTYEGINEPTDPSEIKDAAEEQFDQSKEQELKNMEVIYKMLFVPATKNYTKLMDGENMKIPIDGTSYEITTSYNRRFSEKFIELPQEAQEIVLCVMYYYKEIEKTPEWDINEETQLPDTFPGLLKCLERIN